VYDLAGRTIVSVCRCGLSQNKPFCDGAHNGHFEHEAVAFNLPPKKYNKNAGDKPAFFIYA
jgi:CDGSH-type Zn-finger protein